MGAVRSGARYLPHDSDVPDGVDGATSTYRYGRWGERRTINYADQPCRINTYGDSMTQCHQVSDGETWQEYLAAHIGEPIRNFGMGGYGVHQACRRLERMEATDAAVPFIVLNIFLDDHYRSLDAYRTLRLGRWWRDYDMSLTTSMFQPTPGRMCASMPPRVTWSSIRTPVPPRNRCTSCATRRSSSSASARSRCPPPGGLRDG